VFLTHLGEVLQIEPCTDYVLANDVLKVYYPTKVDVHVLNKGKIMESISYPNLESINISSNPYSYHFLGRLAASQIEENQLTGRFGARNYLKSGLALKPMYKNVDESIFSSWYLGQISDTSIVFGYRGFPNLESHEIFNTLDVFSPNFRSDEILSLEVFRTFSNQNFYSHTNDRHILKMNEDIEWISNHHGQNLLYNFQFNSNLKYFYSGGEIELVKNGTGLITAMDYFNYLNQGRNNWFSSSLEAMKIMDPTQRVKFINGNYRINDVQNTTKNQFDFNIEDLVLKEIKTINNSFLYKRKDAGDYTLATFNNNKLEQEHDIFSCHLKESSMEDYYILEKKVNGSLKKALFTSRFTQLSDFIYDEIKEPCIVGFFGRIGEEFKFVSL